LRASHICASAQAPSRVLDVHRKAGRNREAGLEVDVAPAQRRRMEHAARSGIDHARHDHANPLTGSDAAGVRLEQVGDAACQSRHQALGFLRRRQTDDVRSLLAHRVREHEEGAGRPDIDGHARSAPRVDVEHCRPPAARGFAGGAFDDLAVVEQLLNEQADRAAAHFHSARQVGARDGLMAADERQRDLTVDLPGGAARRNVEAIGINATHLHHIGANTPRARARMPAFWPIRGASPRSRAPSDPDIVPRGCKIYEPYKVVNFGELVLVRVRYFPNSESKS
jgi:hypothetical protein